MTLFKKKPVIVEPYKGKVYYYNCTFFTRSDSKIKVFAMIEDVYLQDGVKMGTVTTIKSGTPASGHTETNVVLDNFLSTAHPVLIEDEAGIAKFLLENM